ncbi:hypothetical protein SLAV_01475 [Streptomyces lavendulae subsp. lavendulae]|uniref:Uncharacterized protein n=1 Tax=Streptomyces lavendulae subsp. lavendulae TaxID=58340 RepID=A0A2K8P651_STRLA|nr:hypothetical protein SLAV_01475 [Streptomyces lavendulae subsp. lavendulae]
MVSLYYPAIADTGIPAPYAPLGEARALLTYRGELSRHTNAEQVAAVRTHAREGALPRTGHGRYPLIVLSPGFTPPCSSADSASRTARASKRRTRRRELRRRVRRSTLAQACSAGDRDLVDDRLGRPGEGGHAEGGAHGRTARDDAGRTAHLNGR